MLGFNTGNFKTLPANSVDPDSIPFKITDDRALVVVVGPGVAGTRTKTLMTIADAIYLAYTQHGIPQISLESHEIVQKTALTDSPCTCNTHLATIVN